METIRKVIPFPGNRAAALHRPFPPHTTTAPAIAPIDPKAQIVALLHEAMPSGDKDLINAFRGIPAQRRDALMSVARAWSGELADRRSALEALYSALTPAEQFHLESRNNKLKELISAFAKQGGCE